MAAGLFKDILYSTTLNFSNAFNIVKGYFYSLYS